MSDQEKGTVKEEPAPTLLADFLEGTAPGNVITVSGLTQYRQYPAGHMFVAPEIQLHCGGDSCNATMFFRRTKAPLELTPNEWSYFYVTYQCSNCRNTEKIFSLAAFLDRNSTSGKCYKFGERPEYGPPTAARSG